MNRNIDEKTAQSLLKGITIPPQPQLMVDLHMEMAGSESSLQSISRIIAKDVGMSGSVLKVVNSPFFGLSNQITSITQALSLLGIGNVVNIVNSLSLRKTLSEHGIIEMTYFWDNAIDVATIAAAISRLVGFASPDEAYTFGLFHNSGIPLLIDKFPAYQDVLKRAYADSTRPITETENHLIGSNHSVVGYYVAKAWKLPGYISEAIADHHKTEAIFSDAVPCEPRKKNLLAILKLAETTCKTHKTLGNKDVDYEFLRIKTSLLMYMGLSEYDFEDMQAALTDMGLN